MWKQLLSSPQKLSYQSGNPRYWFEPEGAPKHTQLVDVLGGDAHVPHACNVKILERKLRDRVTVEL